MSLRIVLTAAIAVGLSACPQVAISASEFINRLEAGHAQTVVVYGTSLTAGGAWVSQLFAGLNADYPGQLTWVNAGLSGQASNSGVSNLTDRVLAESPDAVFIEFAMNDAFTAYAPEHIDFGITLAQSKANLNSMVDSILAQRPNCEIVLQTMNPAWDAPNGNESGTKRPNLAAYYQGYLDVAADRGLLLVDNYSTWHALQSNEATRFATYVDDGTHPNATGYQHFVTSAVRSALGADNGLALLIDPTSGEAVLQNQSQVPIELISYTISSNGNALLTTWDSLTKQGRADWFEAKPTTRNLSELNPSDSLQLPAGAIVALENTWNEVGRLDVTLMYQTPDGAPHAGVVIYSTATASIAKLAGDYNRDQSVDAADYVVWRMRLGTTYAQIDYNIWRGDFAQPDIVHFAASPTLQSAVPEPVSLAMLVAGMVGLILRRSASAQLPNHG